MCKITTIANDPQLDNATMLVNNSFDLVEREFERVKKETLEKIREQEKIYLQNSYRDYELYQSWKYEWFNMKPGYIDDEIKKENIQHYVKSILTHQLDLTDQDKEIIKNRIGRYSNWKSSAMIIHPATEAWTDYMVGNDPLYLVDETYELLKFTLEKYNKVYQNRLRSYVIQENLDQKILWQIPDSQFGMILVYNYFDRRPFEIIQQYLTELYEKLKPGGTLLMTYNDCDRWQGVLASETGTFCYTPGWLIRDWATKLGFEQVFHWHEDGPWSWIELRKPGEFVSIKGGQSLAKILPKPVA
jgi:SAM-dependent methyltransferase